MNATPIVIVSLALTAAAGIPVLPSPVQDKPSRAALEREWAEARARWKAKKPANYEFVLNIPTADSPWDRRFGTFRVTGATSETIAPVTDSMAPLFRGRTTIDALFDLVAGRIAAAPDTVSPSYDEDLGYVTRLFSPDYRQVSFEVPVLREFSRPEDVREPFALVQHVNHCGFFTTPTDLGQCPDYSIAIWGDGVVVYVGDGGVRTLGRREHKTGADATRDLSRAISDSGFFSMEDDYYSSPSGVGIDHSAEKWITIRVGGRQKTVHDFYGAPEALLRLEAAIEKAADSRRYTGRSDTRQ